MNTILRVPDFSFVALPVDVNLLSCDVTEHSVDLFFCAMCEEL